MFKKILHGLLIILVLSIPTFSWASQNTELKIVKINPDTICPTCGEWFAINENQDFGSLQIYNHFFQDTIYYLSFFGPKDKVVTVFGDYNHGTERGFLILIKTDDEPVVVRDFNIFKPNEWTEITADGFSGGYHGYIQPYENLQTYLSSVKWGTWWLPSGKVNN